MFLDIFIRYPRGYKLLVLILILSFLIAGPAISADNETVVVEPDCDIVFLDNGGHGLHGIRGGIVFSPEDTQGYGYTDEEIVFNLMRLR